MGYMLMPSEVARLVYGYINETEDCQDVAKQFLQVCPLLREFAAGLQKGIPYLAKINNMTLLDYLNNSGEQNHESTQNKSTDKSCLDQDILISSMTSAITNAMENLLAKQNELHDQSFQQLLEQFKSMLLISLQTEFSNKIRDLINGLESNFIRAFNTQRQNNTHLTSNDILRTPRNNLKYNSPYRENGGLSCSTVAHSSLLVSPRRKSFTPRRLPNKSANNSPATSTHSHLNPSSQFSNYSEVYSSPSGTDYSEIDIQAFIDKPSIVNKFIETTTSDEKWAQKIASKINLCMQTIQPSDSNRIESEQISSNNNMEIDLQSQLVPTRQMQELLDGATTLINDDSEYNHFVNDVILSTPFKLFQPSTPSSAATSQGSLNTPNIFPDTPTDGNSSNKENGNNDNSNLLPVKNLLNDLSHQEVQPCHQKDSVNSLAVNSVSCLQLVQDPSIQNIQNVPNSTYLNTSLQNSNDDSTITLTNCSFDQPQNETATAVASLSQSNCNDKEEFTNPCRELVTRPRRSITKQPVFLNQHLNSVKRTNSFSRLKNDQKYIKTMMNYSGPTEVRFDGKGISAHESLGNKQTSRKAKSSPVGLTTTIDKVASPTKPVKIAPATSVHSIDSNMIQISNNQVQLINQFTGQKVLQQQSDQICFTSAATVWDSSAVSNEQPVFWMPSNDGTYVLANIAPQITTTSQNKYLQVVSNVEQQAGTGSLSMPILTNNTLVELTNSTNHLSSQPIIQANSLSGNVIGINDLNNLNKPIVPRIIQKPNILSKSDSFKKSQLLESSKLSKFPENNINESPRIRKEPRKSDLSKRLLADEDRDQSLHAETSGKRRRENSSKTNFLASKLDEQVPPANSQTDKVKTILNSNFDDFLNDVHKPTSSRTTDKSNEKSQSKRQSTAANSKSRKEKEPISKSRKSK